jgi:hypothetical protein
MTSIASIKKQFFLDKPSFQFSLFGQTGILCGSVYKKQVAEARALRALAG